jgi:hypothetical protein
MSFNGWRNYPTWAVFLWLGNDEVTYNAAVWEAKQGVRALREFVEGLVLDESPASLASDLLGWALDEVDWESVVAALLEG